MNSLIWLLEDIFLDLVVFLSCLRLYGMHLTLSILGSQGIGK
jgi:hypothetical protein